VKMLLGMGADPSVRDAFGRTPADAALEFPNRRIGARIVDLLLRHGANAGQVNVQLVWLRVPAACSTISRTGPGD
jgi:ankyrin repeat protein